jgi:hypothetical protein
VSDDAVAAVSVLQQRLDRAARELQSERLKCEAALAANAQLQQRLDASLSMSHAAAAAACGIDALLPPSPPHLNAQLHGFQSPPPPPSLSSSSAAAASPPPSLFTQLSEVSVPAADARSMAAAAAAAASAVSATASAVAERAHHRAAAAAAAAGRMAAGVCGVARRVRELQAQVQAQQRQLKDQQVRFSPPCPPPPPPPTHTHTHTLALSAAKLRSRPLLRAPLSCSSCCQPTYAPSSSLTTTPSCPSSGCLSLSDV